MKELARRCVVSGRVQGVYYRAATQKRAQQLGLRGWVRNLANGRVELYACGEATRLESLCHWLQQGPELAQVESVDCTDCEVEPWSGFTIR
jgi:acylphosphatase